MRRATLVVIGAVLLLATQVSAQGNVPRVHTLNVTVDPADLPAWLDHYQQYDVPALTALVEDGDLLAFDMWVHHTGGKHSLRYNYVVPDFGAVAEIGGRYMQRLAPGGAASFGSLMSTMQEMSDGIWYIGDSNLPDDRPESPYVYESALQIEPASLEQWKADFERYSRPGLERAMEEGLITAWARLDHSIGGPWNSKTVFWLDSWDAIDDVLELLGETASELGAPMAGSAAVRDHTDMIWRLIPQSGN
jgi:hypothetical protein